MRALHGDAAITSVTTMTPTEIQKNGYYTAVMSGMVSRILDMYERADMDTIATGRNWYAAQRESVSALAANHDSDTVCGVISALSPRTRWQANVAYAIAALNGQTERPRGCIGRNWADAMAALQNGGKVTGQKRIAFAANLRGDEDAVTVDTHAAAIAGVDDAFIALKGGYDMVAQAYRVAAKVYDGNTPAQIQAITWIVRRGSAN